jgi:hypothetical protein
MILVILVSPRFQHWISWTIFYGLFAINLIVDAFLLAILYRQNIKRHLPWFVAYIAWEFLIAIVAPVIWFVDPKQYVTVYWWTEAMRAVLMAGAVRESFLRTFVGFTSLRWFPWLVRGLIVTVVLYSTWKSVYAPPVQSGRMTAFLIGIEFAFRWCIAAIGILFFCRIETASSGGFTAKDPGVRSVDPRSKNPGDPLPGLTQGQLDFFNMSKSEFTGPETVAEA